jgi:hypothetical protein
MPRKKAAEPRLIFQIKINLLGSKPSIWRRVLVPSDFTLEELHWVIQAAMPWTNSHLHQFIDENEKRYSDPRFQLEDVADEKRTFVFDLLRKPKDWVVYEYDFGDGWEHIVELEKVIEADAKQKLPACVAGKRAAPPDDCGGIGGYEHLLDVLKDPEHEEHDDMIEWLGGPFDPAAFDPADFERSARRLRLR